jgi:hypothetical protein
MRGEGMSVGLGYVYVVIFLSPIWLISAVATAWAGLHRVPTIWLFALTALSGLPLVGLMSLDPAINGGAIPMFTPAWTLYKAALTSALLAGPCAAASLIALKVGRRSQDRRTNREAGIDGQR